MPTTAKMVAALYYGILGFLLAQSYQQLLPEGTNIGQAAIISAGIGVFTGWWVLGNIAGRGYSRAAGNGLRGSLTIVFFAVAFFSVYQMVINSTRGRYNGSPMEAFAGAFQIFFDYIIKMADQQFLVLLIGGGIIGGFITEVVKRNWR